MRSQPSSLPPREPATDGSHAIPTSLDSRGARGLGVKVSAVVRPSLSPFLFMQLERISMNTLPNIVLIHGAWANGSAWGAVIQRLQADGYHVTAPQLPMSSLDEDVARVRQVLV